jgi:hypothetical protein
MTKNRASHMAERKRDGVSYRMLADEFGTSKSSAHRTVQGAQAAAASPAVDLIRNGFTNMGAAGKPRLKHEPGKRPKTVKTAKGNFGMKD